MNLKLKLQPDDFEHRDDCDRCAIERAALRIGWIADCFAGPSGIDVLSVSGSVARFPVSSEAEEIIRVFDSEYQHGGGDLELTGGKVVYSKEQFDSIVQEAKA